jgi:hypothetical protein
MAVAGTITRVPARRQPYSRIPARRGLRPPGPGKGRTRQGLQVWPGGHWGPGPPSAMSRTGAAKPPASNRAQAKTSQDFVTVELLFGMDWEVQPWYVGLEICGCGAKPQSVPFPEIRKNDAAIRSRRPTGNDLGGGSRTRRKDGVRCQLARCAVGWLFPLGAEPGLRRASRAAGPGGGAPPAVSQNAAHPAPILAR